MECRHKNFIGELPQELSLQAVLFAVGAAAIVFALVAQALAKAVVEGASQYPAVHGAASRRRYAVPRRLCLT